jgi:RNA polymerase sigma factor (sigma-70 family)
VKEFTDQEIIDCLKSRQSYVVHWLSERYLPMIRLMVHQMGGSLEDAKDIFQDGLMIMLEKIDNDDYVITCKFRTYLYCVCENLMKAVLDKRTATSNYLHQLSEDFNNNDFTEISDHNLYNKIFSDALGSLEPACQKILKLYWQEIPPKEIAEELGVTYGYVRKKKCEGQAEFIKKVKQHPDYIKIRESERLIKDIVH